MTLHVLDHVLIALLVAIFPVMDFFDMRRRAARIGAGEPGARMVLYNKILFEEWIATAVVLVAWFLLGRTASTLGLIPQGGTLAWLGYGAAAVLCAALLVQVRTVTRSAKQLAAVRKEIGSLSFLMPHTRHEKHSFYLVSLTAGICEELLFRGYLMAYLVALLDIPMFVAALLAGLLFGLAHAYQGPLGALKAGGFGVLMGALYVMTGSIWAPVVAHALMDMTSGAIVFASLNDPNASDDSGGAGGGELLQAQVPETT